LKHVPIKHILSVIGGKPLTQKLSLTPTEIEVPCPSCLEPMALTTNKLRAIFMHYFINDEYSELDVMCFDCLEKIVKDDDLATRRKIKIIAVN
jgi:hypothetical protein